MKKSNLFLVGPMGSGKTTIGRRLAKQLGRTFYDTDKVITERTGVDIPLIFELEGEEGFRKREAVVVDDMTRKEGIVLATGGGSILLPENRNLLGARGFCIYLKTTVEQQLLRTGKDRNRPLLQTDDPRKTLEELMAHRDPLYTQVADLVMETDAKAVGAMVEEVIQRLEALNLA